MTGISSHTTESYFIIAHYHFYVITPIILAILAAFLIPYFQIVRKAGLRRIAEPSTIFPLVGFLVIFFVASLLPGHAIPGIAVLAFLCAFALLAILSTIGLVRIYRSLSRI